MPSALTRHVVASKLPVSETATGIRSKHVIQLQETLPCLAMNGQTANPASLCLLQHLMHLYDTLHPSVVHHLLHQTTMDIDLVTQQHGMMEFDCMCAWHAQTHKK